MGSVAAQQEKALIRSIWAASGIKEQIKEIKQQIDL